jgi:hypothetical protein
MMKTFILSVVLALSASQCFATDQPQAPVNSGFEKLKALVGQWKGKAKDGGEVQTSYRLVAGGSAIEEFMSHGNMVTMYHVDGGSLMLTHYCVAQNQPRMRAAAFKDGDKSLKFAFVDATNMADPNSMHMHNLTFSFHDADHLTQEWTMYVAGKEKDKVVIDLERVK